MQSGSRDRGEEDCDHVKKLRRQRIRLSNDEQNAPQTSKLVTRP